MDENQTIDQDRIIKINIEEEMKSSYIDYSMSVIVARALPDVRDGFKPVHRRILYGMRDIGNTSSNPYKKCARVVGEVLGKYHPHGDSSVYGALVRLAQDWNMRYTLVDGQGNFGSVDGDSAAAMRYTECRLEKIGEYVMDDLDKDTVDMVPNFDETLLEPTVMPTKIPNLLVNGGNGIAVGMATNMPTHNLSEVIDGCCAYIDNEEINTEELMQYIQAPTSTVCKELRTHTKQVVVELLCVRKLKSKVMRTKIRSLSLKFLMELTSNSLLNISQT